MVSVALLAQHGAAFAIIVLLALIAGQPLHALLRMPLGWPGRLLLGVGYWAVALYLFPFTDGLDIALTLAVIGCAGTIVPRLSGNFWPKRTFPFRWQRLVRPGDWILLVGSGAYLSLLATNYVPPGMDASM